MEQVQSLKLILNELKEIREEYKQLHQELKENQEILIELLKINNKHTKEVYNATIKDKSPEQQAKDFLLNVAANLAGNAVAVPTILNMK